MTNFAGAFDLSRLAQKSQATPTQKPVSGALSSWLVKADEQVLRDYMRHCVELNAQGKRVPMLSEEGQ